MWWCSNHDCDDRWPSVGWRWRCRSVSGVRLCDTCGFQFVDADGGNDSTLNLVTVTSTPKEQPFYVGMTGFVYGSGCILGPIVGGSLADSSATWRWVSLTH